MPKRIIESASSLTPTPLLSDPAPLKHRQCSTMSTMSLMRLFKRTPAVPTVDSVTIRLEHAEHVYDDGTVGLQPTNLEIHERRVAVIGLNGSGKTTLLKMMDGALQPTSGTVTITAGEQQFNTSQRKDNKQVAAHIGKVRREEIPNAYCQSKTIAEAVATAVRKSKSMPRTEIDAHVGDLFARFALADSARLNAAELDSERRHLLAVVAALATRPCTIVADEPTKGLDEHGTDRVATSLFSGNLQVIFATHDVAMTTNPRYAIDRTILMHEQRVVFDGDPLEASHRYDALIQELMQ